MNSLGWYWSLILAAILSVIFLMILKAVKNKRSKNQKKIAYVTPKEPSSDDKIIASRVITPYKTSELTKTPYMPSKLG